MGAFDSKRRRALNNRLEAALLKEAEIAAAERQIAALEALNNRLEAALLKEEGALEIAREAAAERQMLKEAEIAAAAAANEPRARDPCTARASRSAVTRTPTPLTHTRGPQDNNK